MKPYQEDLVFDAPRVASSPTSEAAAEKIAPTASTLRNMVLELLRREGPRTDEEIQIALGMNPSTERPRRVELVESGLVIDSGETRLTRSGRKAVLWRVVP